MNVTILRRVRRMFNNDWVPPEHNRSYQRQWVRQVRHLGDRWLLARPITRTNINR